MTTASIASLAGRVAGASARDTTPVARPAGSACCWPLPASGSDVADRQDKGIRSVPSRLAFYGRQGAPRAGLCASAVREALNAPWQGLGSATEIWKAVPEPSRRRLNAPRGSVVYWTGGSKGYGHTCFALGDHMELSVDVLPGRPGVADVVPFGWFAVHMPLLHYVGWSWYWGAIDTRPSVLLAPADG